MRKATVEEILQTWDVLDDDDLSTEMIFAMVEDSLCEDNLEADASDIAEALATRKQA